MYLLDDIFRDNLHIFHDNLKLECHLSSTSLKLEYHLKLNLEQRKIYRHF